jgi:hypothetical protein
MCASACHLSLVCSQSYSCTASVCLYSCASVISIPDCTTLCNTTCHYTLHHITHQAPEKTHEIICSVCQCSATSEHNQIVLCNGCNCPQHQVCGGISHIPAGHYYCDSCIGLLVSLHCIMLLLQSMLLLILVPHVVFSSVLFYITAKHMYSCVVLDCLCSKFSKDNCCTMIAFVHATMSYY